MSYKEYIKNPKETMRKYEIYEEVAGEENYSLYKACLKSNVDQHFFLATERFSQCPANLSRVNQLIRCYKEGFFLETVIFLSKSQNSLTLYVISPLPGRGDLSTLVLASADLDKTWLFSSLLFQISAFHSLQVPYLELSPSNILISSGKLYLCPFRIITDVAKEDNYYLSPELLTGVSDLSVQMAADIWALGCIYAELFISITPLFQGVTSYEKLLRMFEVLGVPEWRCVEMYMTWETYKGLKALCEEVDYAFKAKVEEDEVLGEMLKFSLNERPSIEEIGNIWKSLIGTNQKKESEVNTSWASSQKEYSVVEHKESDNVLTVILHQVKGMKVFESGCRDVVVNVAYEIDINSPVRVVSDNFAAAGKIDLNFSQNFHINSEKFKAKYRHEPIFLNVFQGVTSGKKSRDELLGTCEVYIGLLFSSTVCSEKNDNSVYGWYNISDGAKTIGQILVEISTDQAFLHVSYPISQKLDDTSTYTSDSIRVINEDLSRLTHMLSQKNSEKEHKAKR